MARGLALGRASAHFWAMADPFFFGYGSLVNRTTHVYDEAERAHLSGWRRVWCSTPARDIAFLSVVPDDSTELDGLIAHVPGGDWAALDKREEGYARHPATHAVRHPVTRPHEIQVYAVPEHTKHHDLSEKLILLSYVDVVVQGYLREFGEAGVQRFFETTDGWTTQVLNDRAAPKYPRDRILTQAERDLCDHWLNEMRAQVVTLR